MAQKDTTNVIIDEDEDVVDLKSWCIHIFKNESTTENFSCFTNVVGPLFYKSPLKLLRPTRPGGGGASYRIYGDLKFVNKNW